MAGEGDVAAFIEAHGYLAYARRNLAVYREAARAPTAPTVLATSSGFMTYPVDIDASYEALRRAIEAHALTSLLMPAFELEACVDVIVERQLSRPYLRGDSARETQRIRERFPVFMALRCARFRSDGPPNDTASEIEKFVRERAADTKIAIDYW